MVIYVKKSFISIFSHFFWFKAWFF